MPPSTPPPRFTARVSFFRHKEAIEAALLEGPSLRTVYADMKEQLGMSFATFHRYVVRYLPNVPQVGNENAETGPATIPGLDLPEAVPVESKPAPQPAPAPRERSEPAPRPRPATGIGARFQHNAKPDDDDKLI